MSEANDLIAFFRQAGRLKSIAREGWVRVGVKDPESVADHSYRLAVMAMILGRKFGLNAEKLVKMALVHDLGETGAGDITPYDGTSKGEKRERERKAARDLFLLLGDSGSEFYALWEEYESAISEEAWFLKQLDKLEMALQALDYEDIYPDSNFETFWKTAKKEIRISTIAELLRALEAQRGRLQR